MKECVVRLKFMFYRGMWLSVGDRMVVFYYWVVVLWIDFFWVLRFKLFFYLFYYSMVLFRILIYLGVVIVSWWWVYSYLWLVVVNVLLWRYLFRCVILYVLLFVEVLVCYVYGLLIFVLVYVWYLLYYWRWGILMLVLGLCFLRFLRILFFFVRNFRESISYWGYVVCIWFVVCWWGVYVKLIREGKLSFFLFLVLYFSWRGSFFVGC